MKRLIVFTGGGTAGHVYPGLSVIESMKKKDRGLDIIWIGSSSGMEKEIIESAGVNFIGIPSGKLRRYFSILNFFDLFKIAAGLIKAYFVIGRLKPLLVFSKGGFVSVPPVAAAGLRRIPVFSHESDVSPGLATKINSRFSEKIFVSYDKTRKYFAEGRAITTGNPVRAAIFEADPDRGRKLVSAGEKKIIMVIGGSQGALQINRLIEELLPELSGRFVIIHQTGNHDYSGEPHEGYIRRDYIREELPDLMSAADLIISRAGASSLWESAALGKPSILIPLGTGASRGDQGLNADIFKDAGASVVLEGEVSSRQLLSEINRLMDDEAARKKMSEAALRLVNGNPADIITDFIIERLV
ncbi:MAG: undecaprenyldiphospho-muramoylpentapeptide beta-N-acetylglucosaminyltransferase [Spirochaetales bacterium]|uniref:UDP-N-acetylglucosamine--N-acetylmuramyl-(pentapeptide) pyrophosphoryl-undecaprenol N-acetylglucosamine transferase n=1 Tax=Candidatus Thalassospirochaeta sargassi TaxID=3119039 RepID=A0AAJ1IFJ8_9SPIO|nr:undecaprenyldiphospho-muramoylpentapeptide beta-N-acetylglucosaminyltransferase [Spirochaetales bacterium]